MSSCNLWGSVTRAHRHEVLEVMQVVKDGLRLPRDGQDRAHRQDREPACMTQPDNSQRLMQSGR